MLSVGYVTWNEYKVKFLASKGFDEMEVAEKIKKKEELKLDEESKCKTAQFVFVLFMRGS